MTFPGQNRAPALAQHTHSPTSPSSLFRLPNAPGLGISYAGEGIQIALRALGPVLIALAVRPTRTRQTLSATGREDYAGPVNRPRSSANPG